MKDKQNYRGHQFNHHGQFEISLIIHLDIVHLSEAGDYKGTFVWVEMR